MKTLLGFPVVRIAEVLGIRYQSVTDWRGRIPMDKRVVLERLMYPEFAVEQAGSDAVWRRVPDAAWPHPGGRPCLDLDASIGHVSGLAVRPRDAGVQPAHAA